MKSVENPEFTLVKKIQQLMRNNNNIPELIELEVATKEIINKNCIALVRYMALYLVECANDINPETKEMINGILKRSMGMN